MPGEGQPATPPPVPEAAPSAPEPEEPPAEDKFKITTGVGVRVAFKFQDTEDPEKITGDQVLDEIYAEPRFSGKVTDVVGWTANFQASGRTLDGLPGTVDTTTGVAGGQGGPVKFELRAMDIVAQLDFMDEFHIWAGRMLTPSDRANFSGPWFIGPWIYPGSYFVAGGPYVGPRGTEELGRDTGLVVWGDVGKGKFKYYLGAMDLDANFPDAAPTDQTPLYTGRLAYAFIGAEPGFYGSSTYYGSQDILAIGAAVQYQKDFTGSAGNTGVTDDLVEFNADLLAEFTAPGAGTFGVDAAYYHFDGDSTPMDDHFFVTASYLTPDNIGIGKIQPLVRYQQATNSDADTKVSIIEGAVAYVMKDYFAKLELTFTHADAEEFGGVKANMLHMGFQIQQ